MIQHMTPYDEIIYAMIKSSSHMEVGWNKQTEKKELRNGAKESEIYLLSHSGIP